MFLMKKYWAEQYEIDLSAFHSRAQQDHLRKQIKKAQTFYTLFFFCAWITALGFAYTFSSLAGENWWGVIYGVGTFLFGFCNYPAYRNEWKSVRDEVETSIEMQKRENNYGV